MKLAMPPRKIELFFSTLFHHLQSTFSIMCQSINQSISLSTKPPICSAAIQTSSKLLRQRRSRTLIPPGVKIDHPLQWHYLVTYSQPIGRKFRVPPSPAYGMVRQQALCPRSGQNSSRIADQQEVSGYPENGTWHETINQARFQASAMPRLSFYKYNLRMVHKKATRQLYLHQKDSRFTPTGIWKPWLKMTSITVFSLTSVMLYSSTQIMDSVADSQLTRA